MPHREAVGSRIRNVPIGMPVPSPTDRAACNMKDPFNIKDGI